MANAGSSTFPTKRPYHKKDVKPRPNLPQHVKTSVDNNVPLDSQDCNQSTRNTNTSDKCSRRVKHASLDVSNYVENDYITESPTPRDASRLELFSCDLEPSEMPSSSCHLENNDILGALNQTKKDIKQKPGLAHNMVETNGSPFGSQNFYRLVTKTELPGKCPRKLKYASVDIFNQTEDGGEVPTVKQNHTEDGGEVPTVKQNQTEMPENVCHFEEQDNLSTANSSLQYSGYYDEKDLETNHEFKIEGFSELSLLEDVCNGLSKECADFITMAGQLANSGKIQPCQTPTLNSNNVKLLDEESFNYNKQNMEDTLPSRYCEDNLSNSLQVEQTLFSKDSRSANLKSSKIPQKITTNDFGKGHLITGKPAKILGTEFAECTPSWKSHVQSTSRKSNIGNRMSKLIRMKSKNNVHLGGSCSELESISKSRDKRLERQSSFDVDDFKTSKNRRERCYSSNFEYNTKKRRGRMERWHSSNLEDATERAKGTLHKCVSTDNQFKVNPKIERWISVSSSDFDSCSNDEPTSPIVIEVVDLSKPESEQTPNSSVPPSLVVFPSSFEEFLDRCSNGVSKTREGLKKRLTRNMHKKVKLKSKSSDNLLPGPNYYQKKLVARCNSGFTPVTSGRESVKMFRRSDSLMRYVEQNSLLFSPSHPKATENHCANKKPGAVPKSPKISMRDFRSLTSPGFECRGKMAFFGDSFDAELPVTNSDMGNKPNLPVSVSEDEVAPSEKRQQLESIRQTLSLEGAADESDEIELPPPMKPIDDHTFTAAAQEDAIQKRTQHTENSAAHQGELNPDYEDGGALQENASACEDAEEMTTGLTEEEEIERALEKRSYVIEELISTERNYVEQLEQVVNQYMSLMKDPEVPMPDDLKDGKDRIVFGNIEAIYEWHRDYFLNALEKISAEPGELGGLFKRSERKLHMYLVYCENKPKSEYIVSEYESYFEELRVKIGCKRPLNDLLIVPVQRITKYPLLLRDIIKYTKRAKCHSEVTRLKMAAEVVHEVNDRANDMMTVGRMQGFEGKLTSQGKLLKNGELKCMEGTSAQNFKGKPHQVFLFEQTVMFSTVTKKSRFSSVFFYKNHLQVNKMALLKEADDGDPSKFILKSTDPQRQTLSYVCQAQSEEEREEWVGKIHWMLQRQNDFMRAISNPMQHQQQMSKELDSYMDLWNRSVPKAASNPTSPCQPGPSVPSPRKPKVKLERSLSVNKTTSDKETFQSPEKSPDAAGTTREGSHSPTKSKRPFFFNSFRYSLRHKKGDPEAEGSTSFTDRKLASKNSFAFTRGEYAQDDDILKPGTVAEVQANFDSINEDDIDVKKGEVVCVMHIDPNRGLYVTKADSDEVGWIPFYIVSRGDPSMKKGWNFRIRRPSFGRPPDLAPRRRKFSVDQIPNLLSSSLRQVEVHLLNPNESPPPSSPYDCKPVFLQPMKPVTVFCGETANFSCVLHSAEGIDLSLEWKGPDGQLLSSKDSDSNKFRTFPLQNQTARLQVLKCDVRDAGQYVCIAKTDFGSVSSSAMLKVTMQHDSPKYLLSKSSTMTPQRHQSLTESDPTKIFPQVHSQPNGCASSNSEATWESQMIAHLNSVQQSFLNNNIQGDLFQQYSHKHRYSMRSATSPLPGQLNPKESLLNTYSRRRKFSSPLFSFSSRLTPLNEVAPSQAAREPTPQTTLDDIENNMDKKCDKSKQNGNIHHQTKNSTSDAPKKGASVKAPLPPTRSSSALSSKSSNDSGASPSRLDYPSLHNHFTTSRLLYEFHTKYRHISDTPLGRGRFSLVKKGCCLTCGQIVAVKWIHKDRQPFERTEHEFRLLTSLRHVGILQGFDLCLLDTWGALIADYIPGTSVIEYLGRKGKYSERQCQQVCKQTLEALQFLHTNRVVHLDLRPSNILVEATDSALPQVKLIDFGNAVREGEEIPVVAVPRTREGEEFCPPEMRHNNARADPTMDMWAMGMLILVLLNGRSPFQSVPLDELVRMDVVKKLNECDLSRSARRMISQLLASDHSTRLTAKQSLLTHWILQCSQTPVCNLDGAKLLQQMNYWTNNTATSK